MGENRSHGPCIDCIRYFRDERDKEIHGNDRCSKHHRAYLRRLEKLAGSAPGVITERHINNERKAHQFLAEKFQKFLGVLNDEKVTLIVPADDIHEIRLRVNPIMVRSQRIVAPQSLPVGMLIDIEGGDMSPGESEATVASQPLGALALAREAHKRELAETALRMRELQSLCLEVITAGYNELSIKYHDADQFKRLTLAVQMLRSFLSNRTVTSDEDIAGDERSGDEPSDEGSDDEGSM